GVAHDLDAEAARDAGHRDVVVRRPDAAGGKDEVEVARESRHLAADQLDLVENDDHAAQIDAERPQLFGKIMRVGVLRLAGEDLVADDDDAGGLRHDNRFYTKIPFMPVVKTPTGRIRCSS